MRFGESQGIPVVGDGQTFYDCRGVAAQGRAPSLFSPGNRGRTLVSPLRFNQQFLTLFDSAVKLSAALEADALLLLVDAVADWDRLQQLADGTKILIAADERSQIEGARERGFATVVLKMPDAPVYERLTQALLESVADDILAPGARVVSIYSG